MGALWISEMLHSCLSNNANTEQKSQLNVCGLFGFDDFLPLVSHHVSERLDPSAAKFLSACLISSTFKFTLDLLLCNLVGNRSHQVVAHVFELRPIHQHYSVYNGLLGKETYSLFFEIWP